jgi:Protein of unknown function (DUF2710)
VTLHGSNDQLSESDIVDAVLRELTEAADRWEALVAQAEAITYSVDLGDVQAVVNSDGKLIELTLHPAVTTEYTHGELSDRLNLAFTALREEAQSDNQTRYGGGLQ